MNFLMLLIRWGRYMTNIIFSIVIPVYNVEKYLDECVTSIQGQSFKKYEIILVDDGSTDRSGDMCDEYAKRSKNIKVIHQKNGRSKFSKERGS